MVDAGYALVADRGRETTVLAVAIAAALAGGNVAVAVEGACGGCVRHDGIRTMAGSAFDGGRMASSGSYEADHADNGQI